MLTQPVCGGPKATRKTGKDAASSRRGESTSPGASAVNHTALLFTYQLRIIPTRAPPPGRSIT